MANAIYANARAKALETRLLGIDRLNRMIESNSAEDALKVLFEVNFGEGASIEGASDFEKLINVEYQSLINFIKNTCPSVEFKNYFLVPKDFHNAEAFIKAKYLKIDADTMTVEDGLFDKEVMKEKIMLDEYKDFPDELSKALLTCDSEFVAGKANGSLVNCIFKKALYNELNKNAKKDKEIKAIFDVKADCANIGIAFRTRNYLEALDCFVSGGNLSQNELKSLCEEPFDVLREKAKFFSSSAFIMSALENASKGQPLSDFENMSQAYAVSYLKKRRYQTSGILPFMLYCYYKLSDLNNVRIVMVGLLNGQAPADIKRRLRDGYEG